MTTMPRCSELGDVLRRLPPHVAERKRLSPVLPLVGRLVHNRGFEAMRKVATGWPDAVNRSSDRHEIADRP